MLQCHCGRHLKHYYITLNCNRGIQYHVELGFCPLNLSHLCVSQFQEISMFLRFCGGLRRVSTGELARI